MLLVPMSISIFTLSPLNPRIAIHWRFRDRTHRHIRISNDLSIFQVLSSPALKVCLCIFLLFCTVL